VTWIRGAVSRHRRHLWRGVGLLAGILALAPLVAVDPGVLALLLDVDFVALLGVAGIGLLHGDARLLVRRASRSLPVLWLRVGVALTRAAPHTLTP
jgi:hypothetical protein